MPTAWASRRARAHGMKAWRAALTHGGGFESKEGRSMGGAVPRARCACREALAAPTGPPTRAPVAQPWLAAPALCCRPPGGPGPGPRGRSGRGFAMLFCRCCHVYWPLKTSGAEQKFRRMKSAQGGFARQCARARVLDMRTPRAARRVRSHAARRTACAAFRVRSRKAMAWVAVRGVAASLRRRTDTPTRVKITNLRRKLKFYPSPPAFSKTGLYVNSVPR